MEDEHATKCVHEEEIAKEDAMSSMIHEPETKWQAATYIIPIKHEDEREQKKEVSNDWRLLVEVDLGGQAKMSTLMYLEVLVFLKI